MFSLTSIINLAWKNVVRKLFRNLSIVLAVSLLVGLLVFAVLFNNAVKDDLASASEKLGADIVIVPAEAQDSAEEFILESKRKTFYMDNFIIEAIKDLPEIAQINSHTYLKTLDAGCCSIDDGQVVVFDSSDDFVIKPWLAEGPDKLSENEVYVGNYVYEYLGLIDTASLFGQGVKVVGHLDYTGTGIDHGIFMRKEDIKSVSAETLEGYNADETSIVFVKLLEGADPDEVVGKIRNINPMLGIMTRGSIGADIRNTLSDIVRIFKITIFISTLLSALLAWSTFTAITNERRREIGVLRSLGARKSHVVFMFLFEAIIVAIIGGIIGSVIGHYLIVYLGQDFNLLTRLGAQSVLVLNNLFISVGAIVAGVVVCVLGAFFPVMRLVNLEPLLAIKEE